MSLRFLCLFSVVVCFVSAQYYAAASAYPYLGGAYAPSNLAGGVPAVLAPSAASYGYYGYPSYASVIGKRHAMP